MCRNCLFQATEYCFLFTVFMNPVHTLEASFRAKNLPELRPGFVVRVHQKIKDGAKTRTQIFEGTIIACKHGQGPNGTITVRKLTDGIGVERIFPIHLPTIEKFEVMRATKVRRAKLYYLRSKTARETKKKMKTISLKKPASESKEAE